jgi:hypothetical protein
LYQTEPSVATGDLLLKPLLHRIRQVHGLSTEVNPGQAVRAFEILDHMSVIAGTADFRDLEESDQLVLSHDGGTGDEPAIEVAEYVLRVDPAVAELRQRETTADEWTWEFAGYEQSASGSGTSVPSTGLVAHWKLDGDATDSDGQTRMACVVLLVHGDDME